MSFAPAKPTCGWNSHGLIPGVHRHGTPHLKQNDVPRLLGSSFVNDGKSPQIHRFLTSFSKDCHWGSHFLQKYLLVIPLYFQCGYRGLVGEISFTTWWRTAHGLFLWLSSPQLDVD